MTLAPRRMVWCPRDRRRAGADDGVVGIGVEHPIDVESQHQRLRRRDLVIEPRVDELLMVTTDIRETAVSRQHERRERARQERRSTLPRDVGRGEEEGLVLDERTAG